MTLVAVFELVGVGGVLPLVSLASEPDQAMARPWMRVLYAASGADSIPQFIWRFGLALLGFLLCKVALTAYALYRTFRFSYDVQVSVGSRMLDGYLAQEYEFFLLSNSAVLLKNITAETLLFTGGVLIPALLLISQTLIMVAVTALVALVSPGMALGVAGLLGGLTALLYLGVHRRLTGWGKVREAKLAELNRIAHEALTGAKAVKALNSEEAFVEAFRREGRMYATSNTRYQTAAAGPTLLIELVLFGGAIAVILFYSAAGRDITQLLPIVSLFGVAAYRMLPAARMAFSHVVTIRYHWESLRAVEEGLRGVPNVPIAAMEAADDPALPARTASVAMEHVSYRYPHATSRALEEITIEIPMGARIAFVGASGAGKTTIVDLLMGLLRPTEGRIVVGGVALTPANRRAWQQRIGYVPQQGFLADASLRANIAFGVAEARVDEHRLAQAVRRASLDALIARLPQGLATVVGENGARLSGGERQRVSIARALYRNPDVLILDEATSALDVLTEREINEEVITSSTGLTLIIVTHRLTTVRACDCLVLLEGGRIAAKGSYEALLKSSPIFAAMDRQSAHPFQDAGMMSNR